MEIAKQRGEMNDFKIDELNYHASMSSFLRQIVVISMSVDYRMSIIKLGMT